VRHGAQVEFDFRLAERESAAFMARLSDSSQGRVGWFVFEP